MRNREMKLVFFAICQIIIFYVMFAENRIILFWIVGVFDLFACLLRTVEIIMFDLSSF
jgi:hypothetical protein